MLKKAMVAPRGQATARDDPGRLPPRPCGAQALAPGPISPPISFEPPTRGWLSEAIYVKEGHGGAQRPGNSQR